MHTIQHAADLSPLHKALDDALVAGDWDTASEIAGALYWASRPVRMGDIGEPLEIGEGEEEDEPLFAPTEVPARPEPVPA